MIKSGAKALGNIALTSGVNLLGDVLAGKSVKQAAKARALEGANTAKIQAIQQAQRYAQTGRGRSRRTRRSTRKRRASRTKGRAKKRKASASTNRRKPTKRARTSPRDIFGFVHSKSGEYVKTELDLFSVPPTQVSLEKGLWIDHQPVSSVSDAGPITFLSPGTENYVDLANTILVVRAKVTKANGNNLAQDEHVGIVNNFLHSLFKQVDVFFKEKQVTQATGTYAYRAHLETLLNYGPAAQLTSFIGITVNGEEVPFRPLQLSYTAATIRYIEAYLNMFSAPTAPRQQRL